MTKDTKIDEDLIRKLAEILDDTNLTEIEYERDECRIKVARQITATQVQAAPMAMAAPTAPAADASGVAESAAPQPTGPEGYASHPGAVKSPMVGNAYLAPKPGDPPFVSVGAQVQAGQTLMIIEAMKVMNQIKAPKAGTVTHIFVHDAEPIEFDQVMLVIE